MFATGLIVFRETLEAALFIGIIAATTRGVARRTLWISGGVLVGILGALLMASGMGQISALADGIGQELLNVCIIVVALMMLTWHCVWVSTHGREMAQNAKNLGLNTREGKSALWVLSLAVMLSVLREGAETVLFIAGFLSGSPTGLATMLIGAIFGLISGTLVGVLIYLGLAQIKAQHLFSVTNALVLVLAGSLASQLAKTLSQAGLVSNWSEAVWDSSWLLANDSSLGVLLHALAGYDAQPSALQLAFYLGAITLIWLATQQVSRRQQKIQRAA
ncbi:MAG: FTR1 family protein [Pseudomonadota bacterium]